MIYECKAASCTAQSMQATCQLALDIIKEVAASKKTRYGEGRWIFFVTMDK